MAVNAISQAAGAPPAKRPLGGPYRSGTQMPVCLLIM
jgi:hypothetical protein